MKLLKDALRWLGQLPRRLVAVFPRLLHSVRAWVILILLVIGLLIAYYVASDRYAPLTTDGYAQAYVVQMAARVEGQVIRVHVKENDRVKRGELLFEIDPRPYEHRVARLEAKLAEVVQQVAQLGSDLAAARAEQARLTAEESYASAVHGQEDRIFKRDATTERKYLDALQKHKAAIAALDRSAQLVRRAEQALEARIGAEHALIAEVRAELAAARLDLEYTRTQAPADGIITDLQLREGAYAHRGQPVLTVIDTSQWQVVANFRENCLEDLAPGQAARVSFNQYPGRLFPARVTSVGWGVRQGQGMPSGSLPAVRDVTTWLRVAQRFQVRLTLDDAPPISQRVGMTATVSVITNPESWLNPVTGAVHQLFAWFDFIY